MLHPGKNIGVGYHSLLQRIFLTQGSNLSLLHCGKFLYLLTPQLEKNHVVPTAWQDEALARDGVRMNNSKGISSLEDCDF